MGAEAEAIYGFSSLQAADMLSFQYERRFPFKLIGIIQNGVSGCVAGRGFFRPSRQQASRFPGFPRNQYFQRPAGPC